MVLGPSFAGVLDAARTGADWAWASLYRDLAPVILGYLRAHGAAEPEDLMSEVFLQVVKGLPHFEGDEASWRSWVFVIVHRRLLDERRRRGRHPVYPAPPEELDSVVGDVEAEALGNLDIERICRLLAHLSPDQRDVMLLRVVADLSLEDVAGVLGKRVGAVKALQRRGLARLHKLASRQVVSP